MVPSSYPCNDSLPQLEVQVPRRSTADCEELSCEFAETGGNADAEEANSGLVIINVTSLREEIDESSNSSSNNNASLSKETSETSQLDSSVVMQNPTTTLPVKRKANEIQSSNADDTDGADCSVKRSRYDENCSDDCEGGVIRENPNCKVNRHALDNDSLDSSRSPVGSETGRSSSCSNYSEQQQLPLKKRIVLSGNVVEPCSPKRTLFASRRGVIDFAIVHPRQSNVIQNNQVVSEESSEDFFEARDSAMDLSNNNSSSQKQMMNIAESVNDSTTFFNQQILHPFKMRPSPASVSRLESIQLPYCNEDILAP